MKITKVLNDNKPVLNKLNHELVDVMTNVGHLKIVHKFDKVANRMNSYAIITCDKFELETLLKDVI